MFPTSPQLAHESYSPKCIVRVRRRPRADLSCATLAAAKSARRHVGLGAAVLIAHRLIDETEPGASVRQALVYASRDRFDARRRRRRRRRRFKCLPHQVASSAHSQSISFFSAGFSRQPSSCTEHDVISGPHKHPRAVLLVYFRNLSDCCSGSEDS